ncbi:MAG: cation diffusion facilitator family transporter [Reinekea sp.]
MSELNQQERYKIINRVNWICTGVDSILTIFKLSVGILFRSPALIADGLHSLSDLGTDLLALVLGNLSKYGPDEDHPYGHARYETIGTAILGTVLIMVALLIGFDNLNAFIHGHKNHPHWLALVAAAISIFGKEVLFHYTMRFAKKTRSSLLEANAWHSRSDSLSSVAVFIGLAFSLAGYSFVEYIAALAVALLIGKMGYQLAWDAAQDLIDRGVSPEQAEKYTQALKNIDGILDVHNLRTRLMASDVLIDAHIQVAPRLTISEAHQINDYATDQLKKTHPEIQDVTLHIDFEADQNSDTKTMLKPVRNRLIELFEQTGINGYNHFHIHYHNNQVDIELMCFRNCQSWGNLNMRVNQNI